MRENEGQNEGQNWAQNWAQNYGQNYGQNTRRSLTGDLSSLPIVGDLLGGVRASKATRDRQQ